MQDTTTPEPTQPNTQQTDEEALQASLDAIATMPGQMPGVVCAGCGRHRTLADDYDYTPLQLVTRRPLGWFNGDGEQMCGDCLGKSMRGELH